MSTSSAVAFFDAYPVSRGHALVLPRRHEPDFFALTAGERLELMSLADDVYHQLQDEFGFDGVNLGVNAGRAAGQTIDHAHLHVIPRYTGDVQDPAGGVRWVLPNKAKYW